MAPWPPPRPRARSRAHLGPPLGFPASLLSVVFSLGFVFAAQETFPGHFQDVFGSEKNERESAGNLGKPATTESVAHDQRSKRRTRGRERERERDGEKCWLVRNPLAFRSSSAMSGVFIDAGVLGKRLEQIYRSWTDKVRSSGPCPSAIEPCLDTWTPGLTLFFFFFVKRLKVSRLARAVPPRMPSRSRRERAPRTCGT